MKILASSVVRLAKKGNSHGHLYLIDNDTAKVKQIFNHDDHSISFEGRGGDRGLRGIAFYKDQIIVGSGSKLFFFDKNFKVVDEFESDLFGDIHEIIVKNDELIITSTQYDLILFLDLIEKKLTKGYYVKPVKKRIKKQELFHKKLKAIKYRLFYWVDFKKSIGHLFEFEKINPATYQPVPTKIEKSIHINSLFFYKGILCFTGTQYNYVFGIKDDTLVKMGVIPYGTHNVQPYKKGLIMNYTAKSKVIYTTWRGFIKKQYPVQFDKAKIAGNYKPNEAKPGWNRGLAFNEHSIIVGCSPATINIIEKKTQETRMISLDSNVRNAIHGLEILK